MRRSSTGGLGTIRTDGGEVSVGRGEACELGEGPASSFAEGDADGEGAAVLPPPKHAALAREAAARLAMSPARTKLRAFALLTLGMSLFLTVRRARWFHGARTRL